MQSLLSVKAKQSCLNFLYFLIFLDACWLSGGRYTRFSHFSINNDRAFSAVTVADEVPGAVSRSYGHDIAVVAEYIETNWFTCYIYSCAR